MSGEPLQQGLSLLLRLVYFGRSEDLEACWNGFIRASDIVLIIGCCAGDSVGYHTASLWLI